MGRCACGACVATVRSQLDGGARWHRLRSRRWWNGLGVARWTEMVELHPEADGITRCPDCRDELRPDGRVRHAQPQLQLELERSR